MSTAAKYTLSFWDKVLLTIVPPVVALLIWLWNHSCRVTVRENQERDLEAVRRHRGAVYATWHQRMFHFFSEYGARHVTMMGSLSKDGEYAARAARRLGFYVVRGSGSYRGREAMHELIELLNRREGHTVGMMADGPKGPPRQLKMGTIRIARDTGLPIIPMMCGAKRRIVFKSWDRYFLPVPFTQIVILHGEPLFVPPEADNAECERLRQLVTDRLNEMADRCDTWWGGEPVGKPGFDLPPPPAEKPA